ncbi:hypothetical protein [Robertmurraya massiliosenegalensis]|uniref:hypothetical protein n=1 Tax=Robertmurraya massiliosenegalensis TaxID=1287657 RepID=UPI0003807738|nr:hypothetical protein [Robertmurraya massiliosenegalensis]
MWSTVQFIFYFAILISVFYFFVFRKVIKIKHHTTPALLIGLTLAAIGLVVIFAYFAYDASFANGFSISKTLEAISRPFNLDFWSNSHDGSPSSFKDKVSQDVTFLIKSLTIMILISAIIFFLPLFSRKNKD